MSKFNFELETQDSLLGDLIQTTRVESGGQLTKFSKTSVIRAILFAFSRMLAFVKGYIASVEIRHFLSSCYGEDLDNYARENYNETRRPASASSAEIFIKAQPGTIYPVGTEFKSLSGISFYLKQAVVIPLEGLAFGEVESEEVGEKTKVYVNSILRLVSQVQGHLSVTNLQPSIGGFSEESDDQFKARLYSLPFQVSRNVPLTIESIVYTLFSDTAKVRVSADASGSTYIGILKLSGASLSDTEISDIKQRLMQFLNITNVIYWNVLSLIKTPVDISCNVVVGTQSETNSIFEKIQEKLLNYLDFRYWNDSRVRSEVLLSILTEIEEIQDIDQQTFTPMIDIEVGDMSVPFLRSLQVSFYQKDTDTTQVLGANRTDIQVSPYSPNRQNLLTSYIGE